MAMQRIWLPRWSTHLVYLLLYDFAYEFSNGFFWEIFCHRCYIWSHFLSSEQMLYVPKDRLGFLLFVNNSRNWRANPHEQLFCELPRSLLEWTFSHTPHIYEWFHREQFLCVFLNCGLFWQNICIGHTFSPWNALLWVHRVALLFSVESHFSQW